MDAVIHGAVQRLRPKLMTVIAVLASLVPILWASGIDSDVMKPMLRPFVGGMITSSPLEIGMRHRRALFDSGVKINDHGVECLITDLSAHGRVLRPCLTDRNGDVFTKE
jgi:hypothetical protein